MKKVHFVDTRPSFEITHEGRTYRCWVMTVAFDLINVSDTRQRHFRRKWCDEIKEKFDPRLVRITAIIRADGTLWLVGGQHCFTAAKELGFKDWLITIVEAENYPEEVDMRTGLNSVRTENPIEKTAARVEKSEAGIMRVISILTDEGFIYEGNSRAWNNIPNPATIEKIIARYGIAHTKDVLRFIRMAWEGKACATQNQNIWAISALLQNWKTAGGKTPTAELLQVVKQIHPEALGRQAARKEYYQNTGCVIKRGSLFARFIAEEFNKNRKANRLIPKP